MKKSTALRVLRRLVGKATRQQARLGKFFLRKEYRTCAALPVEWCDDLEGSVSIIRRATREMTVC